MNQWKKIICTVITITLLLMTVSCGQAGSTAAPSNDVSSADTTEVDSGDDASAADVIEDDAEAEAADSSTDMSADSSAVPEEDSEPVAEKNGEVIILYTSDIHCGVDQGFGMAGLDAIREKLEAEGFTTLLVDDGDAIQGEPLGTLSKGEAIIDLMNTLKYDVAIPGNHEFDYGMDQFLSLTEKADYPYISCNFTKNDEPVFAPYIIIEAAGMKIGFVGATTPTTFASSTPRYFQDENGNFIYGFSQDETGEKLYQAVQTAVDGARSDGAEYVYLMAHLGLEADDSPWTYADVVSHTNGIDVVLDGHSHDTEQIVMKNKDGKEVTRSAVGTKMNCIGHSLISPEEGIVETDIWIWPNEDSAMTLFEFDNDASKAVDEAMKALEAELGEKLADSPYDLLITDPVEVDANGIPIRMVRRAETNLGDLCADAYRNIFDTDIALLNSGGIRANISKGDVTYKDILKVSPFGNEAAVVEATGQMILDALEWSSKSVPNEFGGFLQVSGLSYEVDTAITSGCTEDEYNMCTGLGDERRVKNVMVGGEPIDPEKTYTVAGTDYVLLENGDGTTAFEGATVVQKGQMVEDQVLSTYIKDVLGGQIGEEYADPYGQGRITITE